MMSFTSECQKCQPHFGVTGDQARGKVVCDSPGIALDLACQQLNDPVYLCSRLQQLVENTSTAVV